MTIARISDLPAASTPTGSELFEIVQSSVNSKLTLTQLASNPTASIGLTAVNGTSALFMRSDAAPALDVTISPTWSGNHTFSNAITINGSGSAFKGLVTVNAPSSAGNSLVVNGATGSTIVSIVAADSTSNAIQITDGGANATTLTLKTTNTATFITTGGTSGVNLNLSTGAAITLSTNSSTRLSIDSTGQWLVGGSAGTSAQVLTSAGPSTPPTWSSLPTFGTAVAGIVPLSGGGTKNFIRADGTWTTPADSTAGTGGIQYYNAGAFASDANFFFSPAAQTINIGTSSTTGIIVGNIGANITIKAGANNGSQTGTATLLGGAGAATTAGGNAVVQGGPGGATSGAGGIATVQGGSATVGDGGAAKLLGANGASSGNGGAITIASGQGTGTSFAGGNILIQTGAGTGSSQAGSITIQCSGSAGSTTGSNISISAGGSSTGTGGNVTLSGGSGGTNGSIIFQTTGTVFTINSHGALGIGSTPSYGTSGQVLTTGGTNSAPTWGSNIANLSGGLTGQIPFQSAANTTTFDSGLTYVGSTTQTLTLGTATTGPSINATSGTTSGNTFAINGSAALTTGNNGGSVNITGGAGLGTGLGGTATLFGGTSPGGGGGTARILGGNSSTTGTSGGTAIVSGGNGNSSANGGVVQITGGTANGSGTAGTITLTGGSSNGSSVAGGAITIQGGSNAANTGDGGAVSIIGGNGGSTSGNGGAVSIKTGISPTGTGGTLGLYTGTTSSTLALSISPTGTVTIAAPSSGDTLDLTAASGSVTVLKATSNGTNDVEIVASSVTAGDSYFRAVNLGNVNWSFGNKRSTNLFVLAQGVGLGSNIKLTANSNSNTPAIQIADSAGTMFNAGFLEVPQNSQTAATYVCVLADSGKHIFVGASTTTVTIPANSSVAYPVGTALTFVNTNTASISITINTDTLIFAGPGSTGSRTLSQYGIATALKISATSWLISGTNLT